MERPREGLETVRAFAAQLGAWDRRLVEIVALGNLAQATTQPEHKLALVCRFDPEPESDPLGFLFVVNLLLRAEHESCSISKGVDLGFWMGARVYLPGGEVIRELGEHTIVWTHDDRETQ